MNFVNLEKEWKTISPEAIDLIKQLLTYDPKKRISCREALESPWLKKYEDKTSEENFLKTNIIQNLILFHVLFILINLEWSFIG